VSDVILGKRLLKQVSVSVLAAVLMSSAVLAEDDAAAAGGDGNEVSIEVIDPTLVDPVPGDETGSATGEEPGELVDPICEDCTVDDPDVVIDPIETDGTVIEEDTPPEVYQTTALGGESLPHYRGDTAVTGQSRDSEGFVAPGKPLHGQQTAREGGFFKWLFGKKPVSQ
jgi:hypothetical protein